MCQFNTILLFPFESYNKLGLYYCFIKGLVGLLKSVLEASLLSKSHNQVILLLHFYQL